MTRYLRYLRIAFSCTCGIACVLLIALWARSYWWWDNVAWGMTPQKAISVSSQSGGATLQYFDLNDATVTFVKWHVQSLSSPDTNILPIAGIEEAYAGFLFLHGADGFLLVMPYWFIVPLTAALAAGPWIRWRFSLRTLLIAITLVAVVLGTVAVLSR